MARELLKGNEAIAEAAIRAGLNAYFGYPITPQTELLEYLARRMPELGRAFVQAESEVAAINMVYGAACAGKRVMTSSSGPGISLMQEGLSYIAGAELPAVVVDVMRGGPGLGNIAACQSDYFQMTRSAGHGDFRPLTLAPATVQEAIDLTGLAFDLAAAYRMLVILLIDGNLGQMMEPAELPPFRQDAAPTPEWAVSGAEGRPQRIITSLYLQPEALERHNRNLQKKLAAIAEREQRFAGLYLEDADLIVVAFGSAARVAQNAVEAARARGMAVGLFRPITLSPFPMRALERLTPRARAFLVVEMNAGQMIDDVRLAVAGRAPVRFYGRLGGVEMLPDEVMQAIEQAMRDTRVTTNGARILDAEVRR
ncbi:MULTISPECIES: 3-methyl-2-oxobutanoate dehydrogenase subunit VorB [Roseiflexus]|uniref:Pyruvate flavodoxin/ferredoxin oxidoreductase domain protein n=1 Tax=Roseiflexus castenholzii (strain DSM 13941 / HLO8) TaxID=383372 RepID=A7NPY0_ROSCS|nr:MULTISPECIES: 3-methyl-2-oxobutanoate dehydrogenase subunit VorB [Roseiflexus]ABU59626.1 pyruvate flavodoxin/ferredoxin oxidoreductase domain protein [Roseiflexus castenholzii DSM 13941]GIW02908.1 MAG: 3-methyl-2-oxobutanoate dehydrogenase subunit VorB [Roseiflexus sp.]